MPSLRIPEQSALKLKCQPEDFVVEELAPLSIGTGPQSLYRLQKRSMGTPEAIAALVERWQVPRKRFSYGGLKDKHAVTTQYFTIFNGPRRNLNQKSLDVTYLGQIQDAFTATHIVGNRFTIVMRDMTGIEIATAQQAIDDLKDRGIPNYFDDQRFGSLGFSGEWIARFWCQGNYERALWLALADAHPDDRSNEKQQKKILREHWGKWRECKELLERSHRRSIVTNLADKEAAGKAPDFRSAFGCLNCDLRGLYLSAYQSALWNRLLTAYLRQSFPAERLREFELASGSSAFVSGLTEAETDQLAGLQLPLPSARQKLEEGPIAELLNGVLAQEGIEQRELRVKYPRDSFFSKGQRAAFIRIGNLQAEVSEDELYPKRQKLRLSFELPRGSYATMVVKRLSGITGVIGDDE